MLQPRPDARGKRGILLLLLFSLVLNGIGITYGLPGHFGWAPDEILPGQVRQGVRALFSHGWHQKYPPLHYYQLALVEAPIILYGKLRGRSLGSLPFDSFLILVGRLLSLFLGAAIVFLVYKCGLEIFDPKSSLFAAGIAALLVPLVYYAKTANLDVPYLFWFMVSVLFFLRLLKTGQTKYYLLFALTAVLSICTKDQAYGLYAFAPLVVLIHDWVTRKKANPGLTVVRFLKNPAYLYAALVALGTFFVVQNLAFNWRGFLAHVKLITGPTSANYRIVDNTLGGHLHLLGRALSQIRFSLGWPLFLVCAAGVVWSLSSKKKNFLLLSLWTFAVPYEILYIHVIRFSFSRYYLPILLILSFYGGGFMAWIIEVRPKLARVSKAAAAVVFLYSAVYAFSLDIYMLKDSRYTAEKWIRQNVPKEASFGLAVWRVYAPRLHGYRSFLLPLSLENFRKRPSRPDFVIVNEEFRQRFLPDSNPGRFFAYFDRGDEPYELVFRCKTRLPRLPLNPSEVVAQINTINPGILIYKKVKRPVQPER
jgi:4-amino-4-deoxy-L-arabinose transferase-like glycosyltransferase